MRVGARVMVGSMVMVEVRLRVRARMMMGVRLRWCGYNPGGLRG